MPVIETPVGTIHYKDYREGDDTLPVLLVHGAGGSYLDWPIQMRRGLQALAVDLPGHGKSTAAHRKSIAAYADAIVAFLDALEITQAVIIGHSMGGAIAQVMALDYADRVRALGLLGTSPHMPVNAAIIEGIIADPEATARTLMQWMWSPDAPPDYREQGVQRLLATPPQVIHDDFVACDQFDVRDRLAEIALPTLVIAGADDKMIRLQASRTLAAAIEDAEIVELEGGSHMFPLERAETVTEIIKAWLESLSVT